MQSYDVIYVLKPDLTDQDVGTIRNEYTGAITDYSGEVTNEHQWGKRQLAFEVKDYTEGVYTFVECKLPPEASIQLKNKLRIDERVIRFIITRADTVRKRVYKVKEKATQ
ncbi:MAG TPA: 30S ribosomal protein S6 [bacterium]